MHVACLYFHYCSPDCADGARLYTMLQRLGQRHRVTLLTGRSGYERRLTCAFDWVPPGVNVHMLDVPYRNRMSTWKRLGTYLGFPLWAFGKGLHIPAFDVVYGISTPLTTALAAAWLARLRGVPWVFEVRDLWPDFPIQMNAVPSAPLRRTLYALERWLYADADHIVTVSPDMTAHVRNCGVPDARATTLLQGTDFNLLEGGEGVDDQERLRRQYDLHDKDVVLYAGTFGRANAIPTLLRTARRLEKRSDIVFVFVGHGHHRGTIEEARRSTSNVRLVSPQPRHRMFAWFKLASLALVPFIDRPVLAANAPAKFFDSLAAGTPVVVTNPGWTKAFVEEHRCGWYVPPGNDEALAACVAQVLDDPPALREAGQRGGDIARRRFDRREKAARLETILEHVVVEARLP